MRTAAVYLGVDFGVAKRVVHNRAGRRCTEVRRRGRRLASLRKTRAMKSGASKVYKQGLKAAAMYGVKCLGMPDGRLASLRTEAGRALPGSNGARSLTLQLAMAKADPYIDASAAPPLEWATAVWDAKVDEGTMARAWRRQLPIVQQWTQVRGPAGATIMSIRRAGWKWPAWHTFISAEGWKLNLKEKCPQDVAQMLRRDLDRQVWRNWCEEQPERAE